MSCHPRRQEERQRDGERETETQTQTQRVRENECNPRKTASETRPRRRRLQGRRRASCRLPSVRPSQDGAEPSRLVKSSDRHPPLLLRYRSWHHAPPLPPPSWATASREWASSSHPARRFCRPHTLALLCPLRPQLLSVFSSSLPADTTTPAAAKLSGL